MPVLERSQHCPGGRSPLDNNGSLLGGEREPVLTWEAREGDEPVLPFMWDREQSEEGARAGENSIDRVTSSSVLFRRFRGQGSVPECWEISETQKMSGTVLNRRKNARCDAPPAGASHRAHCCEEKACEMSAKSQKSRTEDIPPSSQPLTCTGETASEPLLTVPVAAEFLDATEYVRVSAPAAARREESETDSPFGSNVLERAEKGARNGARSWSSWEDGSWETKKACAQNDRLLWLPIGDALRQRGKTVTEGDNDRGTYLGYCVEGPRTLEISVGGDDTPSCVLSVEDAGEVVERVGLSAVRVRGA